MMFNDSSIEAPSIYYLRGIDGDRDVTGYDVTGSCNTGSYITGNDVTGNEREIISRVFFRVFSGTPLESRYEQWNCESNLYRVTIALLPHFSLLNCAISRD